MGETESGLRLHHGKEAVIRPFARTNHRIRASRVRCINADGSMAGIIPTREAVKLAQEQGFDLVEISPQADPPVCRIMDFGKYMYRESRKQRLARKHQHGHTVKEVKFHANVAEHDYLTKVNHAKQFLEKGHKVKLSLTFRGRENAHRELGFAVVDRVLKDCEECCVVDMRPRMMGRSIISMLGPRSSKS